MSRRMTLRFLLLTVCVWRAHCPPGVTPVKKTYSFCDGDVKIAMDLGCENSFLIEDYTLARVRRNDSHVKWPFKFLSGEGTMQILEVVNFTHQSLCLLPPDNLEKEELTHYQPSRPPCSRPNHGSALQGRPLAMLVGVALVFVMFV